MKQPLGSGADVDFSQSSIEGDVQGLCVVPDIRETHQSIEKLTIGFAAAGATCDMMRLPAYPRLR